MKPVAIFRHIPGEGPGYFATFLERLRLPWQLFCLDAGEALPARADDYSGLVFMGGPMSVNDPLPWIEQECALIRAAVEQQIPVLGHCLGGQLLAKALGARVSANALKEIGWGKVKVADHAIARDWFADTKEFLAFHWHGETFSLPTGATLILSSPHCDHQAFALGPHLAMQCHVEMTGTMIESWCEVGAAEIAAATGPGVQGAELMQLQMQAQLRALNAVADKLYLRWSRGLKRD